jgi:hypothetical protein
VAFGGDDLIAIACVIVEKTPFLEGHGHKKAAWDNINQLLSQHGFHHQVQSAIIQQKAEALVAHRKVY